MNKLTKLLPGVGLSLVVALGAWYLAKIPVGVVNSNDSINTIGSYIGASVIALFIGMLINHFLHDTKVFAPGLKFTSKKILKFAIMNM